MPTRRRVHPDGIRNGTRTWGLWVDADERKIRIRQYNARMVLPLTRDEEGVTECAFDSVEALAQEQPDEAGGLRASVADGHHAHHVVVEGARR